MPDKAVLYAAVFVISSFLFWLMPRLSETIPRYRVGLMAAMAVFITLVAELTLTLLDIRADHAGWNDAAYEVGVASVFIAIGAITSLRRKR